MITSIKAALKAAIPLTTILWLNPYSQQLLCWAVLLLALAVLLIAVAVALLVVTFMINVFRAMKNEGMRKSLISLIKTLKH